MFRDYLETLIMQATGFLGFLFIRLLGASMKIEKIHKERLGRILVRPNQRVIYCFWHDRLLMMPFIALGQKVTVLISQHRDGEFISRIISRFGYCSVRGSSTRGGTMALRKMARQVRSGLHGAITPDGPRGPRHRVKEGAILLASLTGMPIIPLAFSSSKKKTYQAGIAS